MTAITNGTTQMVKPIIVKFDNAEPLIFDTYGKSSKEIAKLSELPVLGKWLHDCGEYIAVVVSTAGTGISKVEVLRDRGVYVKYTTHGSFNPSFSSSVALFELLALLHDIPSAVITCEAVRHQIKITKAYTGKLRTLVEEAVNNPSSVVLKGAGWGGAAMWGYRCTIATKVAYNNYIIAGAVGGAGIGLLLAMGLIIYVAMTEEK